MQRTDPTKSDVSVLVNICSMNRASWPVGRQRDLFSFEHDARFHQLAIHHHRFRSQVVAYRRSTDSSRLTPSREDGILDGLAGPHPGDSDAGEVKAQDPTDGTIGGHRHRSGHEFPSAMG